MSTKEELEQRLNKLNKRQDKIMKDKAALEKEQAVKEHQYKEALQDLLDLGIDASEMKNSELKKLLAETEKNLEGELEAFEATLAKSEAILEEFRQVQE
jgi:predicted component of type VI protein secretion system